MALPGYTILNFLSLGAKAGGAAAGGAAAGGAGGLAALFGGGAAKGADATPANERRHHKGAGGTFTSLILFCFIPFQEYCEVLLH